MSAPVFLTQNFSDLYGENMLPVLEEIFRSNLGRHPSIREELFRMKSAVNGLYQYTELHDMPLHSEIPEGNDYNFQKPNQGANKTLKVTKYGLAASISDEAVRDAKFDTIAALIQMMAESADESREIDAANVFNNAFATTNQTTANGAALVAATHALPSGSSFRNRLSTDSDLSQSSLDAALSDFDTEFKGDTGIIKRMMPRVLLVHPDSKRYAMELVGSDLKPDTTDNNMNAIKQDGIRVISSPHLTDTDAWFLLAEKEKTSLTIVEDYGVQTKGWRDEDRDSIKYKSRYREKVGVFNGYGIIGTPGAN